MQNKENCGWRSVEEYVLLKTSGSPGFNLLEPEFYI